MNPAILQKLGAALAGGVQGATAGGPMAGFGQLAEMLRRRNMGQPTQGATLPQTPYHFPQGTFPNNDPGMRPQGPTIMPPPPDVGFDRPDVGRFPGDPGIDPGMTPPQSPSIYGPVPLGGRRRPVSRWGF